MSTGTIGSLPTSAAQRDARNAFVRAFYNGSLDDLADHAIETGLYHPKQTRATIRARFARTIPFLGLDGRGHGQ